MCEATYVACGGCDLPVTELSHVEVWDSRETHTQSVDEDGDPTGDGEYEGGGNEFVESYYECPNCGRVDSLDRDCSPEDCDCDECCEPDPEDEGPDPERVVCLVRPRDTRPQFGTGYALTYPEVKRLATDRTINSLAMPRWRAAEIMRELSGNESFDVEFSEPSAAELDAMPNYERKDENQICLV